MATIIAGTDTFGRVKSVSGTPIVTKFAMFQFLPVYPLQSFYFTGTSSAETTGIPILASSQFVAIHGIPLASVDAASVVVAYARGVFGALAIFGFIVIVPGITYLNEGHLDDFATNVARGLLISLVTGTVGGLLTYAIPLTPRRERFIRQYCAELLGVSADPARVPADVSAVLVEYVNDRFLSEDKLRVRLIRQLVATRANIAQAVDPDRMERKTDELLEQLRHSDRRSA